MKGKGKGSPATGCFNCGGDHYAAQCPQKGKGKGGQGGGKGGKGKGSKGGWFSQSQWNTYYPGPLPQVWRSWYPYSGGKAKGKGGKGVRAVNDSYDHMMTPDGQQMSFSPLVVCTNPFEDDWCYPCNGYDQGAGNQGQLCNLNGKGGGSHESWNNPQSLCSVTMMKGEEKGNEPKEEKSKKERKGKRLYKKLEGIESTMHKSMTYQSKNLLDVLKRDDEETELSTR